MDGSQFPDKILATPQKSGIQGMLQPANTVYAFGEFCLDPSERLLFRSGVPLPLTPKVFDALVLLVENAGHLVEKDEFMKRLWPDTFVGDDTLASNISLLRKALGGQANAQDYIVTVPKRGYRFVAAISEAPQNGGFAVLSVPTGATSDAYPASMESRSDAVPAGRQVADRGTDHPGVHHLRSGLRHVGGGRQQGGQVE